MYIKNKKTGLIQECRNKDVIRMCQKDVEHYEVMEDKKIVARELERPENQKALDEMTVSELKVLAKEKGLEGTSGLNKEEILSVLKGVM